MQENLGGRTAERRSRILGLVQTQQRLTVAALSDTLGVSELSIRRDLEHLEQAGLLKRVHGGAEALTRAGQIAPFQARLLKDVEVKRRIGRAAADLIQPGQTVLLDSGTTVLEIARSLPAALLESGGLTIVTRSLVIASELRKWRNTRLIVLGGLYVHDYDDFVGSGVEESLASLHVHTLFMGSDGITLERGLTTDNLPEAPLYRRMAQCAGRAVVVTASSKIGVDQLEAILAIDEVHALITDEGAPGPFLQTLRERGIEVVTVQA